MKIQKSRDLISDYMEGLRPSTNTPSQLGPAYGFLSGAGLTHIVRQGQLILLTGKDPLPLHINLVASEACLWEHPSLCGCLQTTPAVLTSTLLSSISGVNSSAIEAQKVATHALASVDAAALDLFYAPLSFFEPHAPLNVQTLERLVAKAKKRFGTREVFIDDIRRLTVSCGQGLTDGDLPRICTELTKLARREHVTLWGCLSSMNMNAAKSLCDVAIRFEDLGDGAARLGVQRFSDPKPRFHLAWINQACGRLEKIRRSPWEEAQKRKFGKAIDG